VVDVGRVISVALQFIDGFTKPSQEVIKSMGKMADNIKRNARDIQNAGKTISSVGSEMAKAITVPVTGIATAAVTMSNDFENAMAKVGTIADTQKTPMDTLKKQVIDLSNAVGVGVSDIAEAQYQAISAGVNTASSVDFVATAVKAAKGGFTDTTTAVDGLTTVLNAYGFEADKATQISDQMLLAQNFGKTSFGDMASSMGNVIPIASSLNVSTEELFGSIAVLTKNGIATSEAVTGLKAAYSNVLKPSAEASKTAQQLGLDFSSAHLQSVGWAKFLDEIKEKTGGNAETMAKLFGSTEALNSVTVLAGKGSADFAKVLGQMDGAAGMTQTAYEKMLTPAERMNISFNKIKNSLIKFGATLTPTFEKVAEIISAVGDKLSNLSDAQVDNIVKWAGIVAAIGPAILIFGKTVQTIGKVHKAFGSAIKIFAKFKGVAGLLTSPAGIVIGILVAIALAAFLIIKNWDKVKGFLSGVGGWFKNAFEQAGFVAEGFVSKAKSVVDGIRTVFNGLTTFISGVFTGNWRQAWEGVKGIFKGIFDTFAAICKTPINAVIGIINGAISGLNKINVNIPEWVPGLGGKSFGINIPTIPMLYKGTDNWRGGAAVIHDRGGEIVDLPKGSRVYPHDKSIEMARKEGGGNGSVRITIQKLADKIEVRSDEDIDRIAEALAYKLKKIALNTGTA